MPLSTKLYLLPLFTYLLQEIKDEFKELARRIHHSIISNSKNLKITKMSNHKKLVKLLYVYNVNMKCFVANKN